MRRGLIGPGPVSVRSPRHSAARASEQVLSWGSDRESAVNLRNNGHGFQLFDHHHPARRTAISLHVPARIRGFVVLPPGTTFAGAAGSAAEGKTFWCVPLGRNDSTPSSRKRAFVDVSELTQP